MKSVRPSRLDVILHVGNQVSVKLAARKAYNILRHKLSVTSPPLRVPKDELEIQRQVQAKPAIKEAGGSGESLEKSKRVDLHSSPEQRRKPGKNRLSYLDVDKSWFRQANIGDVKVIEEEVMELFRDVYRRSWNLPFKREVLAHCSNLMNFGASDLAIDEDIQESKYGPLISKYVRIAFWEYQRQLYDADCATGIKNALSRLEGDPVNGKVRLESKEEKRNGGAAASQALPTHEAHFHQFGRIGVLFLDLYSSRALETGEYNPNANILNAKQIELVMKALQIEDLNGILVCMDTNYTGRIISGVEKEKYAVATGLDTWSLNEKVFMQLVQMLYEWNAKKNGRNVQLLSGSNGIGPSGQGLFEDVKTSVSCIKSLLGQ